MTEFEKNLLHWRPQLEGSEDEDRARMEEHRRPPEQTLFFSFVIQLKSFLRPHNHLHWDLVIAIVVKEMVIRVEEPPAYLLKQLEALLSLPISSPPSRVEVEDQAVEVADRDDLLRRWWGGSASPWWQTPSSSSWRRRRRGLWSCESVIITWELAPPAEDKVEDLQSACQKDMR